jgi:hypothetical protein
LAHAFGVNRLISVILAAGKRENKSFRYLKDLFTRLPAAKITQIPEFTPAAWAKAEGRQKLIAQAA